jgi:hypothetical protein
VVAQLGQDLIGRPIDLGRVSNKIDAVDS